MLPRTASGAAAATTAPLRMAFLYVPNGVNMADWTPKEEGAGFELPPTLEPLQGVQGRPLVLTGLTPTRPGRTATAPATTPAPWPRS